jgi:hypothetical protein
VQDERPALSKHEAVRAIDFPLLGVEDWPGSRQIGRIGLETPRKIMWLGLVHTGSPEHFRGRIEVVTGRFRRRLEPEREAGELRRRLASVLGREAAIFDECFVAGQFVCSADQLTIDGSSVPFYRRQRGTGWAGYGHWHGLEIFVVAETSAAEQVELSSRVDIERYLPGPVA